jgi:hypothetical protein
MRVPRRDFADCSPSTQLMASLIFDLPQPLGPYDGGDAFPVEAQFGALAKGFKSLQFYAFEFQQSIYLCFGGL